MSSQRLQFIVKTELSAAIENLESLVECLKRGTIFIRHQGRSILLRPTDPVNIELKARIKADRSVAEESVVLTLRWKIAESWTMAEKKSPVLPPARTGGMIIGSQSSDLPEELEGERRMREGEGKIQKSGEAPAMEHRAVHDALPRMPARRGANKAVPAGKQRGRQ
jgi:hypothetical protein